MIGSKIKNIITGWYRFLTKKENKESKRRYQICMNCDKKTKLGKDYYCSICWCYIPAKITVENERCLIGKWDNENDK